MPPRPACPQLVREKQKRRRNPYRLSPPENVPTPEPVWPCGSKAAVNPSLGRALVSSHPGVAIAFHLADLQHQREGRIYPGTPDILPVQLHAMGVGGLLHMHVLEQDVDSPGLMVSCSPPISQVQAINTSAAGALPALFWPSWSSRGPIPSQ